MSDLDEQVEKLNAAITGLEAQRTALGDAVVDPALAALHQQLSQLEAPSADGGTQDERKLVTILFVDVSGFTALAEKMDAEEVRALINACFESLVPVVQKYEGTIDKFIGDEIMALFGAPVAHEDDPERALRTALEMIDAIAAFNRAHGTSLDLHIGINSGRVIAGKIGTQNRRDYSVMGDAVNIAARLEDASPDGEIFVGLNTYRQTAALFDFEKLPALNLKGKEAAVQVYRLAGLKAVPKSARGIEGLRASLVGRDAELEEIRSVLAELQHGRGSIFAIVGEAGLGKSRLVAEARALSPATVSWAEGRALSYSGGMSYWLARDVLRSILDVKADAPRSKMDAALRNSLEQNLREEIVEIYPYLGRLLEIPMAEAMEARVKFLTGEALQGRILQAFYYYVRARAERHPLVLVWEDLHWCDPSSLQVFESLLPLASEVPLLLLCAYRPRENRAAELLAPAYEACAANYRNIELSPLTRQQSDSLIQKLLKIENLPEKMRDLILDRAEGNPFFLEELLRSLLDAGVIALEQDRVVVTRELKAVDIPDTLQGVLMARIDRLEPENKRTLQNASVIGRVFQERVLAQLSEAKLRAKDRLGRSLGDLQRHEFIQSREQRESEAATLQEDEYIFKHAITHQVAYDSMLMARRKELHVVVARALEALFPERLDELSATLGYHFDRAGAPALAAHYLGRAAERAQATFANTEASAFYQSAIAQIHRLDSAKGDTVMQSSAARLNEGLGDVLTLMGQHADARAAYDCARSFVADSDSIWRSRLFRKSGFSHNIQRHYEETSRAYDSAEKELGNLTSSRSIDWWEEKVQIQIERMHLFYWQGMASEMRELAESMRQIVEQRGTPLQRGKFFEKLALSHLTGSRYRPTEECLELAKLAVFESRDSTNLSELGHIRFVLGFAHLWRGDFVDAVEHLEQSLQFGERCGNLIVQARSLAYLTVAYRATDHLEKTLTRAMRGLEVATKLEMIEYVAMAKANLAWAAWRGGDNSRTELLGREALALWHEMDDPYSFDWMALWPLIATAVTRDDIDAAVALAQGLFLENQHPLHDEVMSVTRQAVDGFGKGDAAACLAQMKIAIETAKRHHYL